MPTVQTYTTSKPDEVTIITENGVLKVSPNYFIPIGMPMPHLKNLTGVPSLPSNWCECNGQTISDGDSPLNGTTLPDLNGDNRFLRGNSTSGGTGGSSTHNHTAGSVTACDNGGDTEKDVWQNGASNNTSTLPPYYDIVWVIRFKD